MAISIRNPLVESLAKELSETLHISMTKVILESLEEKKRSLVQQKMENRSLLEETIRALSDECSGINDLDTRPPDEILGYNNEGIFK